MTPTAWFALGVMAGVLAYPGAEIITNLIANQPLFYPQEAHRG